MDEKPLAVTVPGGELIGVRSGSGRPLLVLHGGPAVTDYSDLFAAELTGWDALRYTQRGVAPSVVTGPFTIEQHVADALAVLDQHDLAAATVLGHSWGGYLATQLAARAPGRVSALVLADPLGVVGDGGLAQFVAEIEARTPEARTRLAELSQLTPATKEEEAAIALEGFRLTWPGYFAVPVQAPPVPDTVRVNPDAFEQASASIAAAMERGDLPGLLAGYTGPVEIVAGECSPLPLEASRATAAAFPDARLTIAPGAGHQVWHEAPGCLAAALARVAS